MQPSPRQHRNALPSTSDVSSTVTHSAAASSVGVITVPHTHHHHSFIPNTTGGGSSSNRHKVGTQMETKEAKDDSNGSALNNTISPWSSHRHNNSSSSSQDIIPMSRIENINGRDIMRNAGIAATSTQSVTGMEAKSDHALAAYSQVSALLSKGPPIPALRLPKTAGDLTAESARTLAATKRRSKPVNGTAGASDFVKPSSIATATAIPANHTPRRPRQTNTNNSSDEKTLSTSSHAVTTMSPAQLIAHFGGNGPTTFRPSQQQIPRNSSSPVRTAMEINPRRTGSLSPSRPTPRTRSDATLISPSQTSQSLESGIIAATGAASHYSSQQGIYSELISPVSRGARVQAAANITAATLTNTDSVMISSSAEYATPRSSVLLSPTPSTTHSQPHLISPSRSTSLLSPPPPPPAVSSSLSAYAGVSSSLSPVLSGSPTSAMPGSASIFNATAPSQFIQTTFSAADFYLSRCTVHGLSPNSILTGLFVRGLALRRVWDCGYLYLGHRGVLPLLDVLEKSGAHVEELSLRGTGMRNQELQILVDILRKCINNSDAPSTTTSPSDGSTGGPRMLRTLDIADNPLSESSGTSLLLLTSLSSHLTRIYLEGTRVDEMTQRAIQSACSAKLNSTPSISKLTSHSRRYANFAGRMGAELAAAGGKGNDNDENVTRMVEEWKKQLLDGFKKNETDASTLNTNNMEEGDELNSSSELFDSAARARDRQTIRFLLRCLQTDHDILGLLIRFSEESHPIVWRDIRVIRKFVKRLIETGHHRKAFELANRFVNPPKKKEEIAAPPQPLPTPTIENTEGNANGMESKNANVSGQSTTVTSAVSLPISLPPPPNFASDEILQWWRVYALARSRNFTDAFKEINTLLSPNSPISPLAPTIRANLLGLAGMLRKCLYESGSTHGGTIAAIESLSSSSSNALNIYNQQEEDAVESAQLYLASYQQSHGVMEGIAAATMMRLANNESQSTALAKRVLKDATAELALLQRSRAPNDVERKLNLYSALAEANINLQRPNAAFKWYEQAVNIAGSGSNVNHLAQLQQNLQLLSGKNVRIGDVMTLFHAGNVCIFTGLAVDHPTYDLYAFPNERSLELEISYQIELAIERHQIQIGFVSLSCGSEILFIEKMLERKCEVHIVLPFHIEDVFTSCVDYNNTANMHRWKARAHNILKKCEVHYVTTERFLNDIGLFQFQLLIMEGLALIRARELGVGTPIAIAVLDSHPAFAQCRPNKFMRSWKNKHANKMNTNISSGGGMMSIIDLQDIRRKVLATPAGNANNNAILASTLARGQLTHRFSEANLSHSAASSSAALAAELAAQNFSPTNAAGTAVSIHPLTSPDSFSSSSPPPSVVSVSESNDGMFTAKPPSSAISSPESVVRRSGGMNNTGTLSRTITSPSPPAVTVATSSAMILPGTGAVATMQHTISATTGKHLTAMQFASRITRVVKYMMFADIESTEVMDESLTPIFFKTFFKLLEKARKESRVSPFYANTSVYNTIMHNIVYSWCRCNIDSRSSLYYHLFNFSFFFVVSFNFLFLSWGSGLYFIFHTVDQCAEFSLHLLTVVAKMDWASLGLPPATACLGMHGGPLFPGYNPVEEKNFFFGAHVCRAARIKAVTPAGHAYASEQFVAALAVADGDRKRFFFEYLGLQNLAKSYDRCALYRLCRIEDVRKHAVISTAVPTASNTTNAGAGTTNAASNSTTGVAASVTNNASSSSTSSGTGANTSVNNNGGEGSRPTSATSVVMDPDSKANAARKVKERRQHDRVSSKGLLAGSAAALAGLVVAAAEDPSALTSLSSVGTTPAFTASLIERATPFAISKLVEHYLSLPAVTGAATEVLSVWDEDLTRLHALVSRLIALGQTHVAFLVVQKALAYDSPQSTRTDLKLKYFRVLALRHNTTGKAEEFLNELKEIIQGPNGSSISTELRASILSLSGRIHKDKYFESLKDHSISNSFIIAVAHESAREYFFSYELLHSSFPAINAAMMLLLSKQTERARALAKFSVRLVAEELLAKSRAQRWHTTNSASEGLAQSAVEGARGLGAHVKSLPNTPVITNSNASSPSLNSTPVGTNNSNNSTPGRRPRSQHRLHKSPSTGSVTGGGAGVDNTPTSTPGSNNNSMHEYPENALAHIGKNNISTSDQQKDSLGEEYWMYAAMGEAYLILGDGDKCLSWYRHALEKAVGNMGSISQMYRNFLLLQSAELPVPQGLEELFLSSLGRVIVCAAHPLVPWTGTPYKKPADEIAAELKYSTALAAYNNMSTNRINEDGIDEWGDDEEGNPRLRAPGALKAIKQSSLSSLTNSPASPPFMIHTPSSNAPILQLTPGQKHYRLLEARVLSELRVHLRAARPTVGFVFLVTDTDLLFAEALLELGAELHVLLVDTKNIFFQRCIEQGFERLGAQWRNRVEIVFKRAILHFTTRDKQKVQKQLLYHFNRRILQGLTILRAQQLDCGNPLALCVLDGLDREGNFNPDTYAQPTSTSVPTTNAQQQSTGKSVDGTENNFSSPAAPHPFRTFHPFNRSSAGVDFPMQWCGLNVEHTCTLINLEALRQIAAEELAIAATAAVTSLATITPTHSHIRTPSWNSKFNLLVDGTLVHTSSNEEHGSNHPPLPTRIQRRRSLRDAMTGGSGSWGSMSKAALLNVHSPVISAVASTPSPIHSGGQSREGMSPTASSRSHSRQPSSGGTSSMSPRSPADRMMHGRVPSKEFSISTPTNRSPKHTPSSSVTASVAGNKGGTPPFIPRAAVTKVTLIDHNQRDQETKETESLKVAESDDLPSATPSQSTAAITEAVTATVSTAASMSTVSYQLFPNLKLSKPHRRQQSTGTDGWVPGDAVGLPIIPQSPMMESPASGTPSMMGSALQRPVSLSWRRQSSRGSTGNFSLDDLPQIFYPQLHPYPASSYSLDAHQTALLLPPESPPAPISTISDRGTSVSIGLISVQPTTEAVGSSAPTIADVIIPSPAATSDDDTLPSPQNTDDLLRSSSSTRLLEHLHKLEDVTSPRENHPSVVPWPANSVSDGTTASPTYVDLPPPSLLLTSPSDTQHLIGHLSAPLQSSEPVLIPSLVDESRTNPVSTGNRTPPVGISLSASSTPLQRPSSMPCSPSVMDKFKSINIAHFAVPLLQSVSERQQHQQENRSEADEVHSHTPPPMRLSATTPLMDVSSSVEGSPTLRATAAADVAATLLPPTLSLVHRTSVVAALQELRGQHQSIAGTPIFDAMPVGAGSGASSVVLAGEMDAGHLLEGGSLTPFSLGARSRATSTAEPPTGVIGTATAVSLTPTSVATLLIPSAINNTTSSLHPRSTAHTRDNSIVLNGGGGTGSSVETGSLQRGRHSRGNSLLGGEGSYTQMTTGSNTPVHRARPVLTPISVEDTSIPDTAVQVPSTRPSTSVSTVSEGNLSAAQPATVIGGSFLSPVSATVGGSASMVLSPASGGGGSTGNAGTLAASIGLAQSAAAARRHRARAPSISDLADLRITPSSKSIRSTLVLGGGTSGMVPSALLSPGPVWTDPSFNAHEEETSAEVDGPSADAIARAVESTYQTISPTLERANTSHGRHVRKSSVVVLDIDRTRSLRTPRQGTMSRQTSILNPASVMEAGTGVHTALPALTSVSASTDVSPANLKRGLSIAQIAPTLNGETPAQEYYRMRAEAASANMAASVSEIFSDKEHQNAHPVDTTSQQSQPHSQQHQSSLQPKSSSADPDTVDTGTTSESGAEISYTARPRRRAQGHRRTNSTPLNPSSLHQILKEAAAANTPAASKANAATAAAVIVAATAVTSPTDPAVVSALSQFPTTASTLISPTSSANVSALPSRRESNIVASTTADVGGGLVPPLIPSTAPPSATAISSPIDPTVLNSPRLAAHPPSQWPGTDEKISEKSMTPRSSRPSSPHPPSTGAPSLRARQRERGSKKTALRSPYTPPRTLSPKPVSTSYGVLGQTGSPISGASPTLNGLNSSGHYQLPSSSFIGPTLTEASYSRAIRFIIFADVRNYSKLSQEQTPLFCTHFLNSQFYFHFAHIA
jgi:tetratricopeptide (TPR) repeat protein